MTHLHILSLRPTAPTNPSAHSPSMKIMLLMWSITPWKNLHSTLNFEAGPCLQYFCLLAFFLLEIALKYILLVRYPFCWTIPAPSSQKIIQEELCFDTSVPFPTANSTLAQSRSLSWIQLRNRDDVQGLSAFILSVIVWIKGEMRSPLTFPLNPHLAKWSHTSSARLCLMMLLRDCRTRLKSLAWC